MTDYGPEGAADWRKAGEHVFAIPGTDTIATAGVDDHGIAKVTIEWLEQLFIDTLGYTKESPERISPKPNLTSAEEPATV